MTEQQGLYTIPTQIFLSEPQRAKLDALVRNQGSDLAETVSRILNAYLETLPEPAMPAVADIRKSDLRQRRAALARLRARRDAAGSEAPRWLHSYITELEAELNRIEQ